jgi:subtilisin-like proprotein convertase family protein
VYNYGFDEASGNFQQNNYGNGGAGNDYVKAEAQDGSGFTNANFGTPPDGLTPRMQMYIGNNPTPDIDGDLDNAVIAHEYTHGISNRLTGGPANTSCLGNQEQMGEGWSDFFALMTTITPGDQGTTRRTVGNYLAGQPASGPGFRPTPYSTDMTINPSTYNTIKTAAVPHGVGYVWATMLWDMAWALINEHGQATGYNEAMNLVMEGMKLQPCSPGFVDGRDAILAADVALNGGANQCLIWRVFARRGLGFSALQGSTNSRSDGTQAFDLPPTLPCLSVTPTTITACVNSAQLVSVSANANITGGNLTLSLVGAPANVGASFTTNPLAPGASTNTFIQVFPGAVPGEYPLTIKGTNGSGSYTVPVLLTIRGIPIATTLNSPANGATGVYIQPILNWNAVPGITQYNVQASTASDFSSVIVNSTITGTSTSFIALDNTTYYWRVAPFNSPCSGPFTATSSFSTGCSANIQPPALLSPADGATGISVLPTLDWADVNRTNYSLEIATDIGFTNIVSSINGLTVSNAALSVPLNANTQYFWRVRTNNLCLDPGNFSDPFSFTTNGTAVPCTTIPATGLPLAIPLTVATITSTINIPDCGKVTDVNLLNLNITHTWVSDLQISLTSPQGTTVTLISGACSSTDNMLINFDDESGSAYGSFPCPPTNNGTYKPFQALSAFDGQSIKGVWTLTVRDNASGDGGSLNNWSLGLCYLAESGADVTCYRDADGDGYGNPNVSGSFCGSCPIGWVSNNTDCDDNNAAVHPGAVEICDFIDNNCDGQIDEGFTHVTCYKDADGDGHGNPGIAKEFCGSCGIGYVSASDDCDDNNLAIKPGATEVCNGIDDDCDGQIDEGFDTDGDGYSVCQGDSDDNNPAVNPGMAEVCNGIDDNSNGIVDEVVLPATYPSTNVPVTIPLTAANVTSTITLSGITGNLIDLDVLNLNISHSYINDMVIELTSPQGTTVRLIDQICNGESNILINFDNESANSYNSLPCPPTNNGTYKALEPLSAFYGQNPNGVWTLRVYDTYAQDGGSINAWSLGIKTTALMNCVNNLTIDDVTHNEGNSGPTTYSFTVSLSSPAPAGGVTFDIATANNTATIANNDYVQKSLTGQTIPAGSSTYTFDVTVNSDVTFEPDETFFVNVTNVTNATISDGQGLGTITNDDVPCASYTNNRAYVNINATGINNGTSWTDAFTSLQSALAVANTCPITQIWVAKGTYYPSLGVDVNQDGMTAQEVTFQLFEGVKVYGGFSGNGTETILSQRNVAANVTTLSGDIGTANDNSDNACHVVYSTGVTAATVLDGFTITAGNANIPYGLGDYNRRGSGMLNLSGSSPTVANCTFSGNSAANLGGAMYNENNSSPSVTNCAFLGNSGGGGGGMGNVSSAPTLVNCIFSGNSVGAGPGGAMYNVNSSSPSLTNCTFSGNSSGIGSAIFNYIGCSPILTNTIIWNNREGNATNTTGASIYNVNGSLFALSNPLISYSIIANSGGSGGSWSTAIGADGGNNKDSDPLFVTAVDPSTAPTTAGDLHLQCGSPAINAGTNTGAPSTDIEGNPRALTVADPADIGAYEKQGSCTQPTTTTLVSNLNPSCFGTAVTFTATVTSGGNPVTTGTVTFTEGATILAGDVALNGSGQATFTTSSLTATSHTIIATYSGTAGFFTSNGSINQTVNPTPAVEIAINGSDTICAGESVGLFAITENYLKVLTPQVLTFPIGAATFGAPVSTTPVSGDFVYIPDGTSSYLGCSPYTAGSLAGKVALIDRGTCNFTVKVKNAQNAGAIGVIIVNNGPGLVVMNGYNPTITIPSIFISQADGLILKNLIAQGLVNGTSLSPYTYQWSTGATTSSITVSTTGNYTVQVTDANGCSSTSAAATITVNPIPVLRQTYNGVQVTANNDGIDDVGSFTVCSSTSDNIFLTEITDVLNITPVSKVKVEQIITPTNVTINTAANGVYPLTAIGPIPLGRTATVINPATGVGTVEIKRRAFYDANDNSLLDAGECTGDWIVYTITVNPPPVITCPANITVNNTMNQCGAAVTYAATASNYCGTTISYSPASGSFFPVGTTTVTATATDAANNTASCTFTVTVVDAQNPTITCPANITVNNTANQCGAAVTYSATASDNCPGVSVSYSPVSGSFFPIGTTTVTATATDAAGHTASCTFTVTVVDAQNPSITCPANITVNNTANQCGAAVTYSATASDNCPGVSVSYSPVSGSFFPTGTTTVTATATDAAGHTASCTFTVTVVDAQAPTITCPANITVNNTANQCGSAVTYSATAADNCPGVSVSYSPASGSFFPVGTTTVTATATDGANNTASCTFTVTVVDIQNPTITCPANITVGNNANQCGANVTYTATANDNCSAIVSYSPASGSFFPLGTTTVTATATDPAGHTASCTFTVTVTDAQAPTLICPSDITEIIAGTTVCNKRFAVPNPQVSDNCQLVSLTWKITGANTDQSPLTGINYIGTKTFNAGLTIVTYTAKDAAGNTSTCSFNIWVKETVLPTITCPKDKTATIDWGYCYASYVNIGTPKTSDNCGIASVTSDAPIYYAPGITYVTWTVTDVSGNTRTCTQKVTVVDNQSPWVTSPANVYLDASSSSCGLSFIPPAPVQIWDNCGVTVLTWKMEGVTTGSSAATGINYVGLTNFNIGLTTITYTVKDAAGNIGSSSFAVTITDRTKPLLSCPADISQAAATGSCSRSIAVPDPVYSDNCTVTKLTWYMTGATSASSPTSGINKVGTKTFNVGVTSVTYSIWDAAGNTRSCTFTVTVTDNQNPVVSCPADRVLCKKATNTYSIPAISASDNCGISSTTYQVTGATTRSGTGTNASGLFNLGISTITWTVTDYNGNITTCSTNVNIVASGTCDNARLGDTDPGITPQVKKNEEGLKVEVSKDGKLEVNAYPNPSEYYFNLRVKSSNKETVEIRMYDMLGKLVEMQRGAPEKVYRFGDHSVSGMYMIEVRQAGEIVIVKVVKQ